MLGILKKSNRYNVNGKNIKFVEFSAKNITAYGGIIFIKEAITKLNFKELYSDIFGSRYIGTKYSAYNFIIQFIFGIFITGNRIDTIMKLTNSFIIKKILDCNFTKYCSTFTRFLRRINENDFNFFKILNERCLKKILIKFHSLKEETIVVDGDSTVENITGKKIENAVKGYNPIKPGSNSYHPIIYFISKFQYIIHGRLRPGNAYTSDGAEKDIEEIVFKFKNYFKEMIFRFDRGFFSENIISVIETLKQKYIIKVKFKSIYKLLEKAPQNSYIQSKIDKNIHIAIIEYCLHSWKKARKFIIVREKKGIDESSIFIHTEYQNIYEYRIYVTNLDMENEEYEIFYNQRANCEKNICKYKGSFYSGKINTNNFLANSIIFQLHILAYNLFYFFRNNFLPEEDQNHFINEIRLKYLVIGAKLKKYGNSYSILQFDKYYVFIEDIKNIFKNLVLVT